METPRINTSAPASTPDQFTVAPWPRCTSPTAKRLSNRGGAGTAIWALERADHLAPKMERGKVYKVTLPAMTTSNYFAPGHRIRIEISSSNFPRFDRNLNTGGNNYDESKGVVARNPVHHSRQYPSQVTLSVVKR